MSKITTTHVYKVNGELVVAGNVEEAINIYREHLLSYSIRPEIKSIILIEDDNIPPSSSALIRDKE